MNTELTVPIAQSNILMKYGSYKFTLTSSVYQNFRRSTEWRWPAQQRFAGGQSSQFVGKGADVITLQGVIFPAWRGGLHEVDKFRAMGDLGKPNLLVSGLGTVFGYWLLEQCEEEQTNFALGGAFKKQTFTLTLRWHHGPELNTSTIVQGAVKKIVAYGKGLLS